MTASTIHLRSDKRASNSSEGEQPRVLMVSFNTPPFHFAGAGNQAALLARTMAKEGVTVKLLTSAGYRWFHTENLDGDVPIVCLRESRHKWLRFILFQVLSMGWWLKNSRQYDVVHIHGCTHLTTLVWVVLAKLFGKKSLMKVTCSGVDDLSGVRGYPVLGLLGAMIYRWCDGFVAITPEIAADLKRHGLPAHRVHEIPNGIDTERFTPVVSAEEKQSLRQTLNLPNATKLLVYTGGINPRKNVQFLVDAFADIHKQDPDIALLLVGPCKGKFRGYYDKLIRDIDAKDLKQSVVLTGELPYGKIRQYLRASDVFVFASLQEGMPSSPVEAMACGLPTVIKALPGVTDWIYLHPDVLRKDAGSVMVNSRSSVVSNGKIPAQGQGAVSEKTPMPACVVSGDVAVFSGALRALLESEEKRRVMGVAALALTRQRYDVRMIVASYLDEIYPGLGVSSF